MQPLQSAAPLIVYIDFKSPYAYLAVEPTPQNAQHDLVADWRPFVLDIQSYLGSAKLGQEWESGKSKAAAPSNGRVLNIRISIVVATLTRGLTVRGTVKIWNTDLPAIGMF